MVGDRRRRLRIVLGLVAAFAVIALWAAFVARRRCAASTTGAHRVELVIFAGATAALFARRAAGARDRVRRRRGGDGGRRTRVGRAHVYDGPSGLQLPSIASATLKELRVSDATAIPALLASPDPARSTRSIRSGGASRRTDTSEGVRLPGCMQLHALDAWVRDNVGAPRTNH
jgi:hypothetical protein